VYAVSAIACAAASTVSFLKIHGAGRALLVWIFGVLTIGCGLRLRRLSTRPRMTGDRLRRQHR